MDKQNPVNQHAAKTRGEAGATPPCREIAAPVPPGFGGHSRLVLLGNAAHVLAACMRWTGEFVRHEVLQFVCRKENRTCHF